MAIDPDLIREVVTRTEVLRLPRQALATFGLTTVEYYLVSEPAYDGLLGESRETVVRHGKVTVDRPQLVTPYYLLSLFRGFEHGSEFAEYLVETYGRNSPGLLYNYQQELHETSIVSDPLPVVAGRLIERVEKDNRTLAAVIQGVDELWDISLMKFIYELTLSSLLTNVNEFNERGLLGSDRGLPRAARLRIDEMFSAVKRGQLDPKELKDELDRWGVFDEYEDRFLDVFRRR